MKSETMRQALKSLDQKLAAKRISQLKLLIGGGSALTLAHGIPLQTADIDGVPFKSSIDLALLDKLVKETGKELKISPDWLNPYFGTFLMSLPSDYGDRLIIVYKGKSLEAYGLGLNDLLIMKCFAGREKDIPHAKVLIKKGANIDFAQNHIENLIAKNIPGAASALHFLLEVEEQLGE